MGTKLDARWLLTGTAVGGYLIYQLLKYQLNAVRTLAEVDEDPDPKDAASPQNNVTNRIPLESLYVLSTSPNYDLREAAMNLVFDMVFTNDAFEQVLTDLASSDEVARRRALKSIELLKKKDRLNEPFGDKREAHFCSCLIKYLISIMPEPPLGRRYALPHIHDEALIIKLLVSRLDFSMSIALKQGLINDWLAKYPFGETPAQRQACFEGIERGDVQDKVLVRLVRAVSNYPQARQQLRKHGLIGSTITEGNISDDDGAAHSSRLPTDSDRVVSQLRPGRTGSDRGLRRWNRREAMVINDGEHPLEGSDIHQRVSSFSPVDQDVFEGLSFEAFQDVVAGVDMSSVADL